jgi:ubiquinone/menaquinone biosynthesis C-methylase UbiE
MKNNLSYQSLSKFYDLFDLIFLFGGKGNPRPGLLDAISNTTLHILDVCVGTAASSLLVASHNDRNQILGVDISAEMLAVAKRKIARKKLTNLEAKHVSHKNEAHR